METRENNTIFNPQFAASIIEFAGYIISYTTEMASYSGHPFAWHAAINEPTNLTTFFGIQPLAFGFNALIEMFKTKYNCNLLTSLQIASNLGAGILLIGVELNGGITPGEASMPDIVSAGSGAVTAALISLLINKFSKYKDK